MFWAKSMLFCVDFALFIDFWAKLMLFCIDFARFVCIYDFNFVILPRIFQKKLWNL